MKQLSFLDKIKVVTRITTSDKTFFIIMGLLIFLSILFATTSKKNAKESKITYGIIYLATIGAIMFKYYKSLSTMFDAMMNNLFIVFYFPNISVYIAAIITTNIIMWISMFSKNTKRLAKAINSAVFFFMHYILILFLSVVSNNKLDVFDSTALYSNADVHSLVELSSNIFLVWIIFLVLYKIIINYLDGKKQTTEVVSKVVVKEKIKNIPNYINKLDAPMIIKRDISNNLGKYINEVDAPVSIKRDTTKNLDKYIKAIDAPINVKRSFSTVNNKENNLNINIVDVPLEVTQKTINKKHKNTKTIYDSIINANDRDLFSDDYKEVLSVLQNEYIPNIKTTKEEELRIEKDNEDKLSQLMELYRSI